MRHFSYGSNRPRIGIEFRKNSDAVVYAYLLFAFSASEVIIPLGHSRNAQRIGYETYLIAALKLVNHFKKRVWHVSVVGNYFDSYSFVDKSHFGKSQMFFGSSTSGRTRSTVVHMRNAVRSVVYASVYLVVDTVVVSQRNLYSLFDCLCAKFSRAVEIGRKRNSFYYIGIIPYKRRIL